MNEGDRTGSYLLRGPQYFLPSPPSWPGLALFRPTTHRWPLLSTVAGVVVVIGTLVVGSTWQSCHRLWRMLAASLLEHDGLPVGHDGITYDLTRKGQAIAQAVIPKGLTVVHKDRRAQGVKLYPFYVFDPFAVGCLPGIIVTVHLGFIYGAWWVMLVTMIIFIVEPQFVIC